MTEKQYGGQTGRESKSTNKNKRTDSKNPIHGTLGGGRGSGALVGGADLKKEKSSTTTEEQKILKAGKIVAEIRKELKSFVKKGILLKDIAEKIEKRIYELGGKPAFPANTSINEIAAHYTPSYDDETRAEGLLKVDFGVHIDGWASDNSMSFDLENSEENKKLIEAAEKSLAEAIEMIKKNKEKTKISHIGKEIEKVIKSYKFNPIANLTGHGIEHYELHAGNSIPNVENPHDVEIGLGIRAIEPFSTTGIGKVHDGKPSGIYQLISGKTPRMPSAREVLDFIAEEYNTLPFCSRWIYKKFGARGLIALKQLEENGNLHHFSQLVESSKAKVAQAEHTLLITKDKVEVITDSN